VAEVVLEVLGAPGWIRVGGVGPDEPPGSMSLNDWDGRDVVMFGWWEGIPGIWRSVGGVDVETGSWREIHSLGLEQLSDLAQPYVRDYGLAGARRRIRWRLEA
jgi:hypothetical protein